MQDLSQAGTLIVENGAMDEQTTKQTIEAIAQNEEYISAFFNIWKEAKAKSKDAPTVLAQAILQTQQQAQKAQYGAKLQRIKQLKQLR